MEWEMPYMAQKAMQARRVRRMEMVDREAAGETDDALPPSEEDNHDSNNDVEAATSLLGGGKSRYHHHAAAAATNSILREGKEDEKDKGDAEARYNHQSPHLSLLAACLYPCYLLGRATTLLTEGKEEQEGSEDGNKKAARHLNREGWWTCLSSCLLASICPLPCLWPTLACTHRRRQKEQIKRRYPHFPSLTPSSTSSFPSSSSSRSSSSSGVWAFVCGSLWPCPLVEEVSFLEEMKRRRNGRSRSEEEKIELTAALSLDLAVAAGKADGKEKGGAAAPVDTKWDMRPIAAATAAPPSVKSKGNGDAGSEAEEEKEEGEWDKNKETSTKDVIFDL